MDPMAKNPGLKMSSQSNKVRKTLPTSPRIGSDVDTDPTEAYRQYGEYFRKLSPTMVRVSSIILSKK